MKKITISISAAQADATAQFLFDKQVRVLLSYSVDDFFTPKIIIICGVPDESLSDFQTHFKANIK